ncbi:MAG: right-handed parallel beta-helix repeat-containing protein [Methanobrevibacter sp.]|uniref:right-handed parallel beta-helix repeat-containing protein n=1 Tax=Methanobrevibacter sp. TaxID=66852 RepID=UPI0025CEC0F9|nr:right-handed parallel beta-helix repeat-containing protein [Methanobrevibacter sp.]MBR0271904.1 right-handed parallel beta-helix repeat-containing protein [Methanobrevibacter sp.]
MNTKKIILSIFLVFIVLLSSSMVFAEDVLDNSSSSDDVLAISENDNIQTSSQQTISAGSNSTTIQDTINGMSDGDTLNFEEGTYTDICIYIDKSITINGNGATLIGYSSPGVNNTNIPEKVRATTAEGGYAVTNFATVYLLNAENIVMSGLKIVGLDDSIYSNAALYISQAKGVKVDNNTIEGSSWGIYMTSSPDGTVSNNLIENQKTTGFLNFGSARTLITNNTVINAKNHGIDVRHGTGPNVQVINNTVIGSKEGIYLMHSKGHTATQNTLINCSISSITCYGSSDVNVYDNTMYKSRIGVLLGGGYSDITIGENKFQLDNLPFPPTFVYYVATAQSDYQSATNDIGVYTDSSSTNETYSNITNIPTPKEIVIDYNTILAPTGTTYNVSADASSTEIQSIIDSMADGDTLSFAENAVYENISIYTDKNIKIIGNGATLIGYDSLNKENVPERVRNQSSEGGYAVTYYAVLYTLNNTNVVISDLNIIARFPGYNTATVGATTEEYKTAGIYADASTNLTITGCEIEGASFGIFMQYSGDSVITNNKIHDQYTNGMINFGSPRNIIANNTISNVVNHGIDVRHGTGPNVIIFNNTINGAKEGIYLMHSRGHMVYNNTIMNAKIASITAYGSGNEYIFNNTMIQSRIGLLLGGGYYNVTIGPNTYNLDFLPFPPTFVTYIAFADDQYQGASKVQGTYSDGAYLPPATIIAEDLTSNSTKITYSAILKDNSGIEQANETLIFAINGEILTAVTDENGTASVSTILPNGNYTVVVDFYGNDKLGKKTEQATIAVNSPIAVDLEAPEIEMYFKNGTKFKVTLTSNGTGIANQSVIITLNGVNNTRTTDENGTVNMNINLRSGEYDVAVYYDGNGSYDPAKVNSKITVLSTISGKDITKIFKNGTQYYATFVDGQGNPLANGTEVKFNINGVMYQRKVNENGTARLNINLAQGTYIITATHPENGETASNTITVLPKITENNDLVKYFKNDSQYVVKVLDDEGNPVGANETVTFNINGVMYERLTNESGYAKLNINLQAGDYIITAMYGGCNVANNITVKPILNATNINMTYKDGTQFKATLVDGQGNPYSGQNVTFNINGVFYDRTTDGNGTAALNINLMAGEYIITSSYNGCNIANTIKITA